jgi:hypothetical protein
MKSRKEIASLTLQQANALIERADSLFNRAARAWERGNNSGNSVFKTRGEQQCERLRTEAESLISPLGITVDYPGLFPSFKVNGFGYHTTESAVSAAIEEARR